MTKDSKKPLPDYKLGEKNLFSVYLFYDKNEPESKEAAEYLTQQGIAFTEIPCRGMWQAKLAIGVYTFQGIDRVKKGIEKLVEERKEKRLKDLMSRHFVLYVDNSPESRLAAKYLEQEGVKFQTRGHAQFFGNSSEVASFPVLKDMTVGFSRSLTGIKNLLRQIILNKAGIAEPYHHPIPKDLAFYQSWDYSSSPAKKSDVVTCFDEKDSKIYAGDINQAPHPIKPVLDTHDFKSWHEVASWEISNWSEISQTKDKKGRVVSLEKKLVLFPDDIRNLKSGRVAVAQDSRCIYQVLYKAYFQDSNRLYRVYANMID